MNRLHRPSTAGEEGFTLIEMLVSAALLAGFTALFMGAVNLMFRDVRHQQGQNEGVDQIRQVVSTLDKQMRYANAVSTPGTTADGTLWVEWRTGLITNPPSAQTCSQWRLTPTGDLQSRTWNPPVSGVGSYTGLTSWQTRAVSVSNPAAGQVFQLASNVASVDQKKQQLRVAFNVTHGRPVVTTSTAVTFTAVNTSQATPPTSPFCQEVARS